MKRYIPQSIKNIYHLCQAVLANFWFGFPSKKIKVIGVTGTNGKTTTCQMIANILEEAGHQVAMASTINFKMGENEWVNATKFTTLSAWAVQKFIREAVGNKCDYLVLETSSHSLDQYRVWGIDYDVAVITNVTREHLDYHKTMENYRRAKTRLFKMAKKAVVNLDMEKPEEYLDCKAESIFGYSLKIQNSKFQIPNKSKIPNQKFQTVIAEDVELGVKNSKFKIHPPAFSNSVKRDGETGNSKFSINLIGDFNIENALAAISAGVAQGISLEVCAKALGKIKGVPGRMESVSNDRDFNIIVDYAVTPDSLEKLYALLDRINYKKGKIIAVFGACGERDRGKRPIMGEIVSRFSDYVIVTNEDPYNEDPRRIIDEVAGGVKGKKEGKNFFKIFDRREAIRKSLELAMPGDFVVITGKGAEETMAVGKKRIPWNDKKVALEELALLTRNQK